MSEAFAEPELSATDSSSLPAIGLSVVVILCVYLAFKAFKEFQQESSLKQSLYDETGINGSYEYKLPADEKMTFNQMKAFLMFLKAHGKPPTSGAKLELQVDNARDILRKQLDDDERKKLKTALVRWMIGAIEVLAQVERDRPGAARLYDKKLVSDEYWDGVQTCFEEVHEMIKDINSEAEFMEEGWGAQIFPQALQLWRVTKIRERQRSEENSGAQTPEEK